ncbi:hypothetical protein TWF569_005676 [Orbilia oligospora]|nr:hypothetical protein TWF569_005676 [Orbilia oligospora]
MKVSIVIFATLAAIVMAAPSPAPHPETDLDLLNDLVKRQSFGCGSCNKHKKLCWSCNSGTRDKLHPADSSSVQYAATIPNPEINPPNLNPTLLKWFYGTLLASKLRRF